MLTKGTLYSYTVHLVRGAFNESATNKLSIISVHAKGLASMEDKDIFFSH